LKALLHRGGECKHFIKGSCKSYDCPYWHTTRQVDPADLSKSVRGNRAATHNTQFREHGRGQQTVPTAANRKRPSSTSPPRLVGTANPPRLVGTANPPRTGGTVNINIHQTLRGWFIRDGSLLISRIHVTYLIFDTSWLSYISSFLITFSIYILVTVIISDNYNSIWINKYMYNWISMKYIVRYTYIQWVEGIEWVIKTTPLPSLFLTDSQGTNVLQLWPVIQTIS